MIASDLQQPIDSPGAAFKRLIRVRKNDSAYIYAIFEAAEGIVAYSTLSSTPGAAYCDLELQVPQKFSEEVDRLLRSMGELVYDLETERVRTR